MKPQLFIYNFGVSNNKPIYIAMDLSVDTVQQPQHVIFPNLNLWTILNLTKKAAILTRKPKG